MAVVAGTEVTWDHMKVLEDFNNSKAGLPPIRFFGRVRTFVAPTNDPADVTPLLAGLGRVGTRNVVVAFDGLRTFAAAAPMRPGDIAVNVSVATALAPFNQYKAWRLDRYPQTEFANWTELTNFWCYEQMVGLPESNRWGIGDGLYIVRPPARGLYSVRIIQGTTKVGETYRGWLTEINRTRAELYRRYYLKSTAPKDSTGNIQQTLHISGPWFTPFAGNPIVGFQSLSGDAPPSRKFSSVSFWIPTRPPTAPRITVRHQLELCFKQEAGVWVTGWEVYGAVAPPDGTRWKVDLITKLGPVGAIGTPYELARPGRDFDVTCSPGYEFLKKTRNGGDYFVHVRLDLTGYNGTVSAKMAFSNPPVLEDGKLDTPWRWAQSHGIPPSGVFGLDFITGEFGIRFQALLNPGETPSNAQPSGISSPTGGGWNIIDGSDHTRLVQRRLPGSKVHPAAGGLLTEIYPDVDPSAALNAISYGTTQTFQGLASVKTFPAVNPPTDNNLGIFAPAAFASAPMDESDPKLVRSALFRGHYLWPVRPLESAAATVAVGSGAVLVAWAIAASRRPRADGTFDLTQPVAVRIGNRSDAGTIDTTLATLVIPAGRQGVVIPVRAPLFQFSKTLHYTPNAHVQVLVYDERNTITWSAAANAPDRVYRVADGWPNTKDPYSQDGASSGHPELEVRARGGYAFAYQYNDTMAALALQP